METGSSIANGVRKSEHQNYIHLGSNNMATLTPPTSTPHSNRHERNESDVSSSCAKTDFPSSTLSAMSIDSADTMQSSPLLFEWAAKASILSSIINLCNSIIGAAMLSLPFAAAHVGWLTAVILLVVCAIVSQFTFQLQSCAAIMFNHSTNSLSSSYYTLSKATFPKLQLISDLSITLSCNGAQASYLIIIGDLMPDVIFHIFGNNTWQFLQHRRVWISIFMVILIIPSTFLRKLDALRFTSSFALICFLFITIIMLIYLYDDTVNVCSEKRDCGIIAFAEFDKTSTSDIIAFFKAIPIYLFAFGAHPLCFSLTNELLESSFSRMNIVSILSFAATTIAYIVISVVGYFTFGENVHSNMLTNYPQDAALVSLVRICVSIAVAFSFAVVCTPGRHCISTMIWRKNASQISDLKFYALNTGILTATFTIAMIVEDLGIVLAIIGSTASVMSILVLPGLFYYSIERKTNTSTTHQKAKLCKLNTYGSIITVIMGIILIPFCLTILFIG